MQWKTREQTLSTTAAVLKKIPIEQVRKLDMSKLDWPMIAGLAIAIAATIAGIAATGVKAAYFLQPAGVLIVAGGTLGVTILTTPLASLLHSAQRVAALVWTQDCDRRALVEQIMRIVKPARSMGLVSIEPMIAGVENAFLRDSLLIMLDVKKRSDLHSALEMKLRLTERQGLADAKVLEVAGGFAPTIGVLGTVVGLIDVLRQFANLSSVAGGVGTAFVSTIYGLGLANLILLPAAHRIHARVAEAFETHEMIMEGVLCIFDSMHPSLVRERLNFFVRKSESK